jgi:pyruvate kinase
MNHRTKFITTLGPASMNKPVMHGLAAAGADIFRSNFVHMQYEKYKEVQQWTREINEELGTSVKLQADIQGPSIRLGVLDDAGYTLNPGQRYTLVFGKADREGLGALEIPVNDVDIFPFIEAGHQITFMNGAIEAEVISRQDNLITIEATNSGVLKSRKGLNLPDTEVISALTEKDRRDLAFLTEVGIDWVAISFVSSAEHVAEVRGLLGSSNILITSKIERKRAVDNLEEIIEASDAVMIARGDLGIELPMEEVPIVQLETIGAAHRQDKPAIVATQMMLSMVQASRPTRAEVSDVATAVFQRADAVMLSEESAEGKDPVNALSTMVRIARRAEQYMYTEANHFDQYWK